LGVKDLRLIPLLGLCHGTRSAFIHAEVALHQALAEYDLAANSRSSPRNESFVLENAHLDESVWVPEGD
jgi:hypothetical protein